MLNYIQLKKPPIDHALPNTPIYNMIRFWGRKPHNLVRKYIECYAEEGEVVLDPFGGCGVVAVEALKSRRRTIYNDLNAYCRFIAKVSSQPVKIKELKSTFNKLINNILNKKHPIIINGKQKDISFNWLYSTKCPKCGNPADVLSTTYTKVYKPVKGLKSRFKLVEDEDRTRIPFELASDESELAKIAIAAYKVIKEHDQILHEDLTKKLKLDVRPEEITRAINEKLEGIGLIDVAGEFPILLEYKCSNNRCKTKRDVKKPDKDDIKKLAKINKMEPAYYYPTSELSYPTSDRFLTQRPGTERVDKLFTNRNLIALSIIRHEIDELNVEDEIKDALLLGFGAILEHVCKMERPNKKGWGVKNYLIHPIFLEQNVLHVLNNRFDTILKGKNEAKNEIGGFYKESLNPKDVINGQANVCFLQRDARGLPLNDFSVDYVFTDPEYGDAIQYYELSQMASSWLNLESDWKNEIVVNVKQGKTLDVYRDMLCKAFKEIHRVLKPNKYMTVTFHSREIKYWNALMYAIQLAGFKYVTAIYQIPQREYTNWLYARNPGEMSGDVYVTFYKPEIKRLTEPKDIDLITVIQNTILPEAREIILLHNGQATFNQLVRGITLCLINKGIMHNPQVRDVNYEKIFNDHFEQLGRSKVWRLKEGERVSPVDFIPLDRRIEWIIFSVFSEKRRKREKVTVSDVLSAIFTTLKNAKTPENKEILDILKDVAEPKQERGNVFWELKKMVQVTLERIPPKVPITRIEPAEELDHDRMIRAISEIGVNFGFDIWIGNAEIRKNPELKKYRTIDELKIPVDPITLGRLKNIDVIWLQRRTMPVSLIEVEHTTDPRVGLLRMANVFEALSHLKVKTFTILPDKRIGKLEKIVSEPSIKRLIGEHVVYYATYSLIAQLLDESEYRKLGFDDFIKICKVLEPFDELKRPLT